MQHFFVEYIQNQATPLVMVATMVVVMIDVIAVLKAVEKNAAQE